MREGENEIQQNAQIQRNIFWLDRMYQFVTFSDMRVKYIQNKCKHLIGNYESEMEFFTMNE